MFTALIEKLVRYEDLTTEYQVKGEFADDSAVVDVTEFATPVPV